MMSTSSISALSLVNPASRTASLSPITSSSQGSNPSLFAKYVLKSKPYEQYVKTAATGVANFLKSAQDMQKEAQKLMQKDQSAWQTAQSSDSKKVAASASAGAANKSYDVKVNAVATAQTNSGTSLSGASKSSVGKGTNEFNITIGGKTTKVSAVITDKDTNDQALSKLKDAINDAKTGVTASIVTDEKTGYKKLELRSDKTGTDQAFQVEDVTGNVISATGVKHATQQASNASYSVNGGATRTSQSNTIELEKGKVTATLVAATTDAAKIQVKPDEDKLISQVKSLVSSYNAMHDRLKEAEGTMNASVRKNIESIVNSTSYERIGIQRNSDGTLKVDEEKLKKSLLTNFDQTLTTLGGSNGLADKLNKAADRYNEASASSLLSVKARQVQQFSIYQSSLQQMMSAQPNGWVVNLLY